MWFCLAFMSITMLFITVVNSNIQYTKHGRFENHPKNTSKVGVEFSTSSASVVSMKDGLFDQAAGKFFGWSFYV